MSRLRTEKSTTDRSSLGLPAALRLTRAAVGGLVRLWPALADRWIERLFLTAPRPRRPAWEQAILAGAERTEVATPEGPLPVWSWGHGPTVLLVHGWGGRGSQLGAFVEPLLAAGRRVVAFDGAGHGDAPRAPTSAIALARCVEAVARAQGPLEAIIAHSVGGAAVGMAAARAPLAGRLVFLGSPAHPRDFLGEFTALFGLDEERVHALLQRLERRYRVPFRDIDARRTPQATWSPLLIVHDRGDREVPLAHGEIIATAWPGARMHVTEGLGHRRILRAPAVIRLVTDFVTGGAARPAIELDRELFERDRRWTLAA